MENSSSIFSVLFCVLGISILIAIFSIAAGIRIVREDTRLSVYRLGRYLGDKGPGVVLLIPIIDRGVLKKLSGVDSTPSRRLVGIVGETHTTVYTDGKVFLASEIWDATSRTPISAGQRVRVVRMILEVEKE
ncbi:MAG: hypothetical protein HZB19_19260 [Chloroflexi bacterium]|nr:hypothetical protein [Chloroflexota bacterium]